MRTHTKTFHIRFTEKEYARLCQYADKAGLPKTTYIRHLINGCCPRETAPEFWEFIKEVHTLRDSLHKISDLAHGFGGIQTDRLNDAMEQHKQMVLRIFDRLYSPERLDIPATLERGRKLAQEDLRDVRQNTDASNSS